MESLDVSVKEGVSDGGGGGRRTRHEKLPEGFFGPSRPPKPSNATR